MNGVHTLPQIAGRRTLFFQLLDHIAEISQDLVLVRHLARDPVTGINRLVRLAAMLPAGVRSAQPAELWRARHPVSQLLQSFADLVRAQTVERLAPLPDCCRHVVSLVGELVPVPDAQLLK